MIHIIDIFMNYRAGLINGGRVIELRVHKSNYR